MVISIQNQGTIPFSSSPFSDTLSSSWVPSFPSSSNLIKGFLLRVLTSHMLHSTGKFEPFLGGSSKKREKKWEAPTLSGSQKLLFLFWPERGQCWSFCCLYSQYNTRTWVKVENIRGKIIHRTLTLIKVLFQILICLPKMAVTVYFSKYTSSCFLYSVQSFQVQSVGEYYGLNCVHPKFTEALTPNVTVFGNKSYNEAINVK